ncbi:venom protease-like [Venturia canescens]|uniref:venom protease-like n=1 Tax=Venturia canescens TaxID=32260 RepID=UPI001C9D00F2|nr:venom protease-like [Venturia canescens]XP_043272612.1 venom protease-like [Venturia canescens]
MYSKIVILGACFLILLANHRSSCKAAVCPQEARGNYQCVLIDKCNLLYTILDATTGRGNVEFYGGISCALVPYKGELNKKICCYSKLFLESDNDDRNNNDKNNGGDALNNGGNDNAQLGMVTRYGPLQPPVCGISNSTFTKVVNGVPASLGNWPWATALGYRGNRISRRPIFECGGALISARHVLTAAHCVGPRLFLVRVGELDLDDDYDGAAPVDLFIEKTTIHPDYDEKTFFSDIAVIKLERDVEFTDLIRPICLPVSESIQRAPKVGQRPYVIGWGALGINGVAASTLQQVQLPLVAQNQCKAVYELSRSIIDDRVLCAGFPSGVSDACQGDSGGPMMYPLGKVWYSIGVISFSYSCALPNWPSVYTKTQYFIDFILQNLN